MFVLFHLERSLDYILNKRLIAWEIVQSLEVEEKIKFICELFPVYK
jgi:hypothetical protein